MNDNNSDKELIWEEVSVEHIVNDEWIDFRRSAYRFPDGNVFEPYYSYSRRNYVVIVASDTEGNYLCVRQFRQGIKKVTVEFPAGGIEVKDSTGNAHDNNLSNNYKVDEKVALEAAVRELKEETGYVSDEWKHLITVPSNPTIADNYAYIFEAKNCRKVTEQELDDMEFLNVEKYNLCDIDTLINDGVFLQPMHIMALLMSKRKV